MLKFTRISAVLSFACWAIAALSPPRCDSLYAAVPFIIDEDFKDAVIGLNLDILRDKTGLLGIDEAASPRFNDRFIPSESKRPNFGYIRDAVWARFRLDNRTGGMVELLLEFPQPFVDHVDFYSFSKGYEAVVRTGDMLPFDTRPVRHRNYIFKIQQEPGTAEYYLRMRTTSTLSLTLNLWSPQAFNEHEELLNAFFWAFYGILMAMLIYNLLIFFSVRDRSYLYYVFFVAMLLAYTMTFNGNSYMYLWPKSVWWANVSLTIFVNLMAAGAYLFARSFLKTWENMPLLDKMLMLMTAASAINALLAISLPPGKADGLAAYTSIPGIAVLALTALFALKKRVSAARIYLVAWLVFIIGGLASALRALAVLPSNFLIHYSIHIGAAFQVILFSSGLAERINSAHSGRLRALEALAESEEKYRRLIENATESIFITRDFRVVFANARTFKFAGRKPEELIDIPYIDYVHPDDRGIMKERFERRISGEDVHNEHEFRIIDSEGSVRWMRVSAMLIDWQGRPAVLNFMNDITERKNSEALLLASLLEKELLLKEMHHRVKNNMQILSSLLSLQMRTLDDESARDIIMESQNRIRSMALIHEKLYQSDNFLGVDFSVYIENLAHSLLGSYSRARTIVRLDIKVENVFLGIDTAIPCGLIVNELITNCFKHAFPEGGHGEVVIRFGGRELDDPEGAFYTLSVRDTGNGIADGVDTDSPSTLGLQLVKTLVGQLRGRLIIHSKPGEGTEFVIDFRSRVLCRRDA